MRRGWGHSDAGRGQRGSAPTQGQCQGQRTPPTTVGMSQLPGARQRAVADNPLLPSGQLSKEMDGHAGARGRAAEDPPGHIPWAAVGTRGVGSSEPRAS